MKLATGVMAAAVCAVVGTTNLANAQATKPSGYHVTDPATGAEIRASQTVTGGLSLELAAPGLTLTKRTTATGIVTVVRVPKDELTIEATRSTMVVSSAGKRVEVTASRPDRLTEARAMLTRSAAAAEAVKLLDRIVRGQYSPLALVLLSTRNMLVGGGNMSATRDAMRDMAERQSRPRATLVSMQDSPTDCWDKYTREALAAWQEVKDCLDSSGVLGDIACVLIYDMRATGAFTWWLKCVAIS